MLAPETPIGDGPGVGWTLFLALVGGLVSLIFVLFGLILSYFDRTFGDHKRRADEIEAKFEHHVRKDVFLETMSARDDRYRAIVESQERLEAKVDQVLNRLLDSRNTS